MDSRSPIRSRTSFAGVTALETFYETINVCCKIFLQSTNMFTVDHDSADVSNPRTRLPPARNASQRPPSCQAERGGRARQAGCEARAGRLRGFPQIFLDLGLITPVFFVWINMARSLLISKDVFTAETPQYDFPNLPQYHLPAMSRLFTGSYGAGGVNKERRD